MSVEISTYFDVMKRITDLGLNQPDTLAINSELNHDTLTATQNRKTLDGFAFGVLLNEDGEGRLELTKA